MNEIERKPVKKIKAMYKDDFALLYGVKWRFLRKIIYDLLPKFKGHKKRQLLPHEINEIINEIPLPSVDEDGNEVIYKFR